MSYAYSPQGAPNRGHDEDQPPLLYDGLPEKLHKSFAIPLTSYTSAGRQRMDYAHQALSQARRVHISRTKIFLIVVWTFVLWWGESHVFSKAVKACHWDRWEQWHPAADPHRVVLVTDPQIVDPHTYPGRPWPLSSLTIAHTDQYLRRSFVSIQERLEPDTALFLGDLFDGGREWTTGSTKSPDPRWHQYGKDYWLGEFARFNRIFVYPWYKDNVGKKRHRDESLIATLPGNHDIGIANGVLLPVRDRFETYFGVGNRIDIIGNHSFVAIDTVSLSAKAEKHEEGDEASKAIWEPAQTFLDNLNTTRGRAIGRELRRRRGEPENVRMRQEATALEGSTPPAWTEEGFSVSTANIPSILLTHVPMYRKPGTPCGPLRERHPPTKIALGEKPLQSDDPNALSISGGYQYRNVLEPAITDELFSKLKPDLVHVFSGDDHDYCEVVHDTQNADIGPTSLSSTSSALRFVPEVTIKSMSWAMGVRRPGFLLVSLWNPIDDRGRALEPLSAAQPTLQIQLCLLPDQLSLFILYGQLLLFTLVTLAIRARLMASASAAGRAKAQPLLPLSGVSTPTSEQQRFGRERADSKSCSTSSNSSASGHGGGLAARSGFSRSPSQIPYSQSFQSIGGPLQQQQQPSSLSIQPDTPSKEGGLLSPYPLPWAKEARSPLGAEGSHNGNGDTAAAARLDLPFDLTKHFQRNRRATEAWGVAVSRRNTPMREFGWSVVQVGAFGLGWYTYLALTV